MLVHAPRRLGQQESLHSTALSELADGSKSQPVALFHPYLQRIAAVQ